jgi:hypothetical protein
MLIVPLPENSTVKTAKGNRQFMSKRIFSFGFATMVLPLVPFDASEDMEAITDPY